MSSCAEHGLHQGQRFVDGRDRHGMAFGRTETYCVPCANREDLKRHPYREHPRIKRLRTERKTLNLSQAEAGRLLGVHASEVSALEQGAKHPESHEAERYWYALRTARAEGE